MAGRTTHTPTAKRYTRVVQLRLGDELHELFEDVAAKLDRPTSTTIRDVLMVWALEHSAALALDLELSDILQHSAIRDELVDHLAADLTSPPDEHPAPDE